MRRNRTKRLKMRDLERATGVGREAIRYYIREGLLPEPERTARNVAWYDESFVVPLPSCPNEFEPQHFTVPPGTIAHV